MTLFDPPAPDRPMPGGARLSDPETSLDAAQAPQNVERWGSQRVALLSAFQGRSAGLTPDRAGDLADVGGYSQRRRCSDLLADGLLEETGVVDDGQRVLRITPAGETALRRARAPKDKVRRDYSGDVMRDARRR
jgi:hypothetical protein